MNLVRLAPIFRTVDDRVARIYHEEHEGHEGRRHSLWLLLRALCVVRGEMNSWCSIGWTVFSGNSAVRGYIGSIQRAWRNAGDRAWAGWLSGSKSCNSSRHCLQLNFRN